MATGGEEAGNDIVGRAGGKGRCPEDGGEVAGGEGGNGGRIHALDGLIS